MRSTIEPRRYVRDRASSPVRERRARGGGSPRAVARRARRARRSRRSPPGWRWSSPARAPDCSLALAVAVTIAAAGGTYLWVVVHKALAARHAACAQRSRGPDRARRRGSRHAGAVRQGLPRRRAVEGAAVGPSTRTSRSRRGDPIVVERVDGLTLTVRRAEDWELFYGRDLHRRVHPPPVPRGAGRLVGAGAARVRARGRVPARPARRASAAPGSCCSSPASTGWCACRCGRGRSGSRRRT